MFWPFRTTSSIGVDLGTANTLMYVSGKGIVLDEPSVVALDVDRGIPLEVGEGAKRMIGKTPKAIQAIRPLRDGVIADYAAAELMIQTFMRRGNSGKSTAPRMVVGIPSSITDVERRAVREAGITGSKEVYLIDETVAAAIGAGLPITEPVGSMIVDIGGGTTDVAVLSLGSPVEANRSGLPVMKSPRALPISSKRPTAWSSVNPPPRRSRSALVLPMPMPVMTNATWR